MLYVILAVVFVVLLFAYLRVRSRRLSRWRLITAPATAETGGARRPAPAVRRLPVARS